VTIRNLSRG